MYAYKIHSLIAPVRFINLLASFCISTNGVKPFFINSSSSVETGVAAGGSSTSSILTSNLLERVQDNVEASHILRHGFDVVGSIPDAVDYLVDVRDNPPDVADNYIDTGDYRERFGHFNRLRLWSLGPASASL